MYKHAIQQIKLERSSEISLSTSITAMINPFTVFFTLTFLTFVSASPHKIPRLSVVGDRHSKHSTAVALGISDDFETYFYNQTLDHFNYKPESYATFKQKYMMNSKHWGGAKERAPIFVYLGAENSLDVQLPSIGFLPENAPLFKALLVYIEHRFYGESNPVGSMEEAIKNETVRGYFNSAQALADYAELIIYLKQKLFAQNCPVIVFGASYGGMLASWFRLKYPHVAVGALASSAPILYFDDLTPQEGYYSVVTKDFKEVSQSCYESILQSWSEIDRIASMSNGLSILSQKFNTCAPLSSSDELKDRLELVFILSAQYNAPPEYPVTEVCAAIDGAPAGTDILSRIFAGVVAYSGNRSCYINSVRPTPPNEVSGWGWQKCSEMVIPIGIDSNNTMFQLAPFYLESFIERCQSSYGVKPRPHWVTTYYGGHDIKLTLNRFGSNIIFSNGLKDPYSIGGVLEDLSDSVLAIYTANGSHCLDVLPAKPTDPEWLIKQRNIEINIIQGWIQKYQADLLAFKK